VGPFLVRDLASDPAEASAKGCGPVAAQVVSVNLVAQVEVVLVVPTDVALVVQTEVGSGTAAVGHLGLLGRGSVVDRVAVAAVAAAVAAVAVDSGADLAAGSLFLRARLVNRRTDS
jgi:hypothetical protein